MKRKKALAKLAARIKDYEVTKARDPHSGRGYKKPGAMK